MFTYKQNPYVKGETLIMNPEGSIYARLFYNDFASECDNPEEEIEKQASYICDLLNKEYSRKMGTSK